MGAAGASAAASMASSTTPAGASEASAAAPTTPAAAPATSGADLAAGSTPKCTKTTLAVSLGAGDAGVGHRSIVVVFRNSGTSACRLHGYPGVAALDANGRQVVQAVRTPNGYLGGLASGTALPTVTLARGQRASATIEGLGFNASDGSACTGYQGFLVTAPDDTSSTHLAAATDMCGELQVHPVVLGTTGQQ